MEGLTPQAWHAGLRGRSFTVLNWLAAPSKSSSFWTSTSPTCRMPLSTPQLRRFRMQRPPSQNITGLQSGAHISTGL